MAVPLPERIEPRLSDEELIARLVRGDPWAKEALYRRYVRLIWGTALRLLANPTDAEDVVQETFIEAFRDIPKLQKLDALRPWLLQIAVHQAHRCFRRRKTLRALGLDRSDSKVHLADLVYPGASPDVLAELAQVDRALAKLPSADRFAWMLRYVEGYRLEEVAAACRCSLATIKRRIARAAAAVLRYRTGGDDD